METREPKDATSLGIRVGVVFLLTVAAIVFVIYYTLLDNFHTLLTRYALKLVEATTSQGVEIVESELEIGRKEIEMLVMSFTPPASPDEPPQFPQKFSRPDLLRLTYVSQSYAFSSDGGRRGLIHRKDIDTALNDEIAIYGPYYNEKREFVICYSAPVRHNGAIVGVLSLEKDGYRFCELIRNIRFGNSGESYILSAEGTDIAVSDPAHIEWVTSEYNIQKILREQMDETTLSIWELERKGLAGESGIGTYYWKGGLVHVVYAPVPSVGWVLLAGMREEELAALTQSALLSTLSKGPIMPFCFGTVLLLTALIIFWIVSSMRKDAEINQKLEIIANHDSLTGLLNRRFLETRLAVLWKAPLKGSGQAAVFMLDIDNFKKYNDCYGHLKGDDCLRCVAAIFKNIFGVRDDILIRYGGEEFMAVAFLMERTSALEWGRTICRTVEAEAIAAPGGSVVTVSVGICHAQSTSDMTLYECIRLADNALYQAKKEGKKRVTILDAPASAGSALL